MKRLIDFLKDESGAVTVDYVVGTAAAIGLSLSVTGAVKTGAIAMGNNIAGALGGIEVQIMPVASAGTTTSGTTSSGSTTTSGTSSDHHD
jgi:hypothetical protein